MTVQARAVVLLSGADIVTMLKQAPVRLALTQRVTLQLLFVKSAHLDTISALVLPWLVPFAQVVNTV